MNIIDFLLDNIFIVVIAAGFLMSLLGKSGGKKPQNRMPTFGGEQEPTQQRRQPQSDPNGRPQTELQRLEQHRMEQQRMQQQEQQREEARRIELARLQAQADRQAEYEAQQRLQLEQRRAEAEAKQQELLRRTAADTAAMQPVRLSAARRSTTSNRLFASSEVNREELRRAVIWAEVLGPPRARRPHK